MLHIKIKRVAYDIFNNNMSINKKQNCFFLILIMKRIMVHFENNNLLLYLLDSLKVL